MRKKLIPGRRQSERLHLQRNAPVSYVKVLEENLPAALDILADLVCNSKLTPDDIEREKGVVLEEIAMNEDSPEDLAHEELCKA